MSREMKAAPHERLGQQSDRSSPPWVWVAIIAVAIAVALVIAYSGGGGGTENPAY